MNIEQSLYASLVQLGLDVEKPQEFVISRIPDQRDLTLGLLKKEEGILTILVAAYRMTKSYKPLPEPEVIFNVIPSQKSAQVRSCLWSTGLAEPSRGLNYRIYTWLQSQILCGHTFNGPTVIA
jgi:hypothetical protein